MTDIAPPPRKSTGRVILIVILALSLLFNALALGAGLRILRLRHTLLGDSAAITLPRDLRRDLGQALVSHGPELRPALQAMQTARRDAVLALTAKPYDAAKASAALDTLRSALDGLMLQAQPVILQEMARRGG